MYLRLICYSKVNMKFSIELPRIPHILRREIKKKSCDFLPFLQMATEILKMMMFNLLYSLLCLEKSNCPWMSLEGSMP